MNTNSKVILDVDRIQKQLLSDYDNTLNKARAKVLAFLILALCKVQDVGHSSLPIPQFQGKIVIINAQSATFFFVRSLPRFRQTCQIHIQVASF